MERDLAAAAVASGTRRYFANRRQRVDGFVDTHFSLAGTLALHRAALGWDIARAPLNLTLAGPQIVMQLGAKAADQFGATRAARALRRSILLKTAVAREIEWLLQTELLELPVEQGRRRSERDALAEAILAEPAVAEAIRDLLAEGGHDDPAFRDRLGHAMGEYGVSRAAAAEITTGLMSLGAGAVALHKLTPGAVSLGPALAAVMAQQAAVSAFPLGGWLGGVWYGLFPASASTALVAAASGGLMLAATTFAAFAGVVSDPVQRALGLHQARLRRFLDGLERQVFDPAATGFSVRDHYAARLLDVLDLLGAAIRLAK